MKPFPYLRLREERDLLDNNTTLRLTKSNFNGMNNYLNCVSPNRYLTPLLQAYFEEHGITNPQDAMDLIDRKLKSGKGGRLYLLGDILKSLGSKMSSYKFIAQSGLGGKVTFYRQKRGTWPAVCVVGNDIPYIKDALKELKKIAARNMVEWRLAYPVIEDDGDTLSINIDIPHMLNWKASRLNEVIRKKPQLKMDIFLHRGRRVIRKMDAAAFIRNVKKYNLSSTKS